MSFHVSDVERLAAMQTAARFGGRRRRRGDWFSLRRPSKPHGYDRRNNSTSDDSNMGSMILPAINLSTNDSLFTTMMKRLNLSADESQLLSSSTKKKQAKSRGGFHPATDSEDEQREWDPSSPSGPGSSHKYNGLKRKENECGVHLLNNVGFQVARASVGVQTSLDSLISAQVLTEDKSCQVSTPLLQRTEQLTSTSSPSGSVTSLSESGKIRETSFILLKNSKNAKPTNTVRSLSPLSKSLKKVGSGNHKKRSKKRCSSENEKIHCVLKVEDLN